MWRISTQFFAAVGGSLAGNRVLVRNLLSMLLWQGGNYLVPLITLPYLSRTLGVRAFGDVAFSFAVVAYFVVVAEWGFGLTSTRLISRHAEDRALVSEIFWDTLNAKVLIGFGSLVALAIVTASIPTLRAIYPLLVVASFAVVANTITVNWCLQGLERLDIFAAGALVGKLATLPAILLLVRGPQDALLSMVIQTGGLLFSGALSLFLLARLGIIGPATVSLQRAWNQITLGWHVFLSTAAASIYTTTTVVVLGMLTNTVAVGQYAGADRIKYAAVGIIAPISNAAYPRVASLMRQDEAAAFAFIRRLIVVQGLVTFVLSLCLFAFAPFLVHLILGEHFAGAIPILRWLAWLPFLIGLSNAFGQQVLLQTGRQRLYSRILIAALPLGLATIAPLVIFYGAPGAAASFAFTEGFVAVAMVVAAVRMHPMLLWPPSKPLGSVGAGANPTPV